MKKVLAFLLALTMVFAAVACSPAGGSAGGAKKYAIIVKSTGNPYNDKEAAGFQEACKEIGVEAIVKAPANPTAEDQIAMIQELISQKVSGIAIAANDYDALENALKKAMDAGIVVTTVDSTPTPTAA